MIDPGVLISDAIAAPAPGQWLLLFTCTSELIVTNSWLLVLIQGEIVAIKGGGGSVLWHMPAGYLPGQTCWNGHQLLWPGNTAGTSSAPVSFLGQWTANSQL